MPSSTRSSSQFRELAFAERQDLVALAAVEHGEPPVELAPGELGVAASTAASATATGRGAGGSAGAGPRDEQAMASSVSAIRAMRSMRAVYTASGVRLTAA